jgi:hypothetical protein
VDGDLHRAQRQRRAARRRRHEPGGTLIVGAESRAHWLGRQPLALTEATIYENGPGVVGGPSAPCTAPAESPVAAASFTPTSIAFPLTQALPARQTSAAQTVTFSNGGGAAMTLTNIYFAGSQHQRRLRPQRWQLSDGIPGDARRRRSCTVSVTFSPTVLGVRQANLSFSDNAANTTDQTIRITGTGVDNTNPTISVTPASRNFGTVNGGAVASQVFTVTNASNDASGRSLTIHCCGDRRPNAADFTVASQTCIGVALAPAVNASCTVTVEFRPGARTARSATLTSATTLRGSDQHGDRAQRHRWHWFGAVVLQQPVNFGTVNRNTFKDQTHLGEELRQRCRFADLASFSVTGTGYSVRSTTCANSCGERLVQRRRPVHCSEHRRLVPRHLVGHRRQRAAGQVDHELERHDQVVVERRSLRLRSSLSSTSVYVLHGGVRHFRMSANSRQAYDRRRCIESSRPVSPTSIPTT